VEKPEHNCNDSNDWKVQYFLATRGIRLPNTLYIIAHFLNEKRGRIGKVIFQN